MSLLLFFASFLYYLAGLSGTVPSYRDAGDLIASIHTLGIAHPPGYAAYILTGKLCVTLLPWGNIAYRVNVLSAVCAALSVVLLRNALQRSFRPVRTEQPERSFRPVRTEQRGAPLEQVLNMGTLAAVVLYATSPAMTALARVAEMYTLAAACAAGILAGVLSEKPAGLSIAAFLFGFGLSVHPTLVFLLPFLLFAGWEAKRPWNVYRAPFLWFLLGLSVVLYLPLRASQDPVHNWGDPSSWRNFWRVITRADYGGLKLHPEQSVFAWTPSSVSAHGLYFLRACAREWGWGALALGAVGMVSGLGAAGRSRRVLGLVLAWIIAGPGFFLLSNLPLDQATTPAILQPYMLLVGVLGAPFLIWGSAAVASKAGAGASPAMAGLLLVLFATRSWSWSSERHDYLAYDFGRNLLRCLPPRAVLYDPDDTTDFTLRVLQSVENRRPDVTPLSFFRTRWGYEQIKRRTPELLPPIPIDNAQDLQRVFWSYSARVRPFYAELPQKFPGVPFRSAGLAYEALPAGGASTAESRRRAARALDDLVRRGAFRTTAQPDFFKRHILGYYAAAHNNLGMEFAAAREWPRAVEHYKAALDIDPALSAAYNNWAIVAYSQGAWEEAVRLYGLALERDPQNEGIRRNLRLAEERRQEKPLKTRLN